MSVFKYPSTEVGDQCELLATAVEVIHADWLIHDLEGRIRMGRALNQVRGLLEHGKFGPWLRWRLPYHSEETTRRWRRLAAAVDQFPKLLEILGKFRSTTAAENFVALPASTQEKVIESEAYGWNDFQATVWRDAMENRLDDDRLPQADCYGDVLHAIEEARGDPALADTAEELYQEHRDTFARLSGRDPVDIDIESKRPEPPAPVGDAPHAQMVEGDSGLWLCRYDGEKFIPVAPIGVHLLMWNGSDRPSTLAAFPKTGDGPGADAWQGAVIDAAGRRVNASNAKATYSEVL